MNKRKKKEQINVPFSYLIKALKLIKHQLGATSYLKIHSPYLFQFYLAVFKNKDKPRIAQALLKMRKQLLQNNDFVNDTFHYSNEKRTIAQVTKSSPKSFYWQNVIFRTCKYLKVKNALEFGTNLGFTAAAISEAIGNKGKLITIEGNSDIAKQASIIHSKLNQKNIKLLVSDFDSALENPVLQKRKFDLIFIDGNHQYEATLKYFNWSIEHLATHGVIILDDIHWSKGMEKAWKELVKNPKATLCVDVFQLGFVFTNPDLSQQNISLKINLKSLV